MKNKNFITIYVCIIIILVVIPGIIFGIVYLRHDIKHVCFDNICFSVELAKTPTEQEKGLMGRASLSDNSGMLFVFNKEDKYPFWMKNTKIALDIIWIDASGKVVTVRSAEPCTTQDCPKYSPTENAKYVLEINHDAGGDLVKVGSQAKFVK